MTARDVKPDSRPASQVESAGSPSPGPIRVLVVDDHPIVREGICRTIERENDMVVCGEATSASEALAILEKRPCNLAVVDISLNGRSGIELIKDIVLRGLACSVMVLTVHDDVSYAERALRAGAMGYVLKQTGAKEIVTAMRRILAGEIYVDEKISAKLISGLVGRPEGAAPGSPVSVLSDRELEVIEAVGEGLGTKAIARNLCIAVSTVETYKANIKTKLNLKDAAELGCFAAQWLKEQRK